MAGGNTGGWWRLVLAGWLAVSLAGCASGPKVEEPPVVAPRSPIKPPVPPSAKVAPKPLPPRPAVAASPAVTALLLEAQSAVDSGNLEGAAATLERGVRLQPRNAQLWQRLAEIRLRQEQPQLAVDLAKKSIHLAGGDRALVKKSWSLIAEAKHRLGDEAGAAEAQSQADAD